MKPLHIWQCAVAVLATTVPNAVDAAPARTSFAWFGGAWTCVQEKAGKPDASAASTWSFQRPDPGGWIHLSYGIAGHNGGNAVVGYVRTLKAWVYDDFHADGSYAAEGSTGANGGVWTFRGTYDPPNGGAAVRGKVEWRIMNDARFDMYFYPPDALKSNKPSGMQSCVRRRY